MKDIHSINRNNIRSLGLALVLMIVLAGGQLFLWGMVSDTSYRVQEKRSEAMQLSEIQENVQKIKVASTAAETVSRQLSQVLIREDQVTQAVERLEREAERQGVGVSVENIQQVEQNIDQGSLAQLSISISAIGLPNRIMQYLDAVEHFPEIVYVSDAIMERATVGVNNPYSLRANVVFYMESKNEGAQSPASTAQSGGQAVTSTGVAPTPSFTDRLLSWGGVIAIGGGVVLLLFGVGLAIKNKAKG